MNVFFTSDLHLGHKRMLDFRPFATVEEMDSALITNWNARVGPKDRVYLLGDVSFHNPDVTRGLVSLLNGEIHLVTGNHDAVTVRKLPDLFETIHSYREVKVWVEETGDHQRITLCHYALRVWNCSHYGAWSLYGHSHGNLPDDPHACSMDVGVDPNGYYPVSFDEVRTFMSHKEFRPIDHHGAA